MQKRPGRRRQPNNMNKNIKYRLGRNTEELDE